MQSDGPGTLLTVREFHNSPNAIVSQDVASLDGTLHFAATAKFLGLEESSLETRAILSALGKLGSGEPGGLGETFGQWRKTTRIVTDRVELIRRAYNRKKRPKPTSCLGGCAEQQLSQAWLEYVYGIVPLMSDIRNAINVLSDTALRQGMTVCVKGSASDITQKLCPYPVRIYPPKGPTVNFDLAHSEPVRTSHKANVSLWYKLEDIALMQSESLGLSNPVETAWNLVPYSFLADWFLPIGPYLRSFTRDSGYSFLGGSCSYKRTVDQSVTTVYVPRASSSSIAVLSAGPQTFKARIVANYFRRWVYTHRPTPGLYFKNPLSADHVINAIALLRANLPR